MLFNIKLITTLMVQTCIDRSRRSVNSQMDSCQMCLWRKKNLGRNFIANWIMKLTISVECNKNLINYQLHINL